MGWDRIGWDGIGWDGIGWEKNDLLLNMPFFVT